MSFSYIQPSLTAGEIAVSLHSRVDFDRYHEALATCRNFMVMAHGGAANRPGTQFVGNSADHDVVHRLIPFIFNSSDTYALVFGNQVMQVVRNGAYVLDTAVNISAITKASPAVVTATAHGFANGDEVYLSGIVGMTELNNRYFIVANATANTFELSGEDSSNHTAYSSAGTAAEIYNIATPYLEADLFDIKYSQSADTMTLTHPDYDEKELTRTGHAAWTLSNITAATGMIAPTGESAVATNAGAANRAYNYVITTVNTDGDESLPSTSTSASTAYTWPAGGYITVSWTAATDADHYRIYKQLSAGLYGYIGMTDTLSFIDDNIEPDFTDTPPATDYDPFSGASDKPSVSTYFQQRIAFANTANNPQLLILSQPGLFHNFNKSIPLRADDVIELSLDASDEIRHLVEQTNLIVLTAASAHIVKGTGENSAIAPNNIKAEKIVGSIGASHVQPLAINSTVLYIQEMGSAVIDLGYALESDGYEGRDLSLLAHHLFDTYQIKQWAYAPVPHHIVWAVRDDGTLLGLTYLRKQKISAWHRHDTDGKFESVCVIPEGSEHAVYVTVRRNINGTWKRFVERLHTRVFTNVRDAFFVDSGLTYDNPITISGATQASPVVITAAAHGMTNGDYVDISDVVGMTELNGNRYVVANQTTNTFELTNVDDASNIDGSAFTAYDSGGKARQAVMTVSGADHLNGESVAILADGNVLAEQTVSNGTITLAQPASRIHLGKAYSCDLQTLRPELAGQETIQGKQQSLVNVVVRFQDTRGGFIGHSFDELVEVKQRDTEEYDTETDLFTGDYNMQVDGNWDDAGITCVRQSDPLPMTVLAFIPEVELGG